MATKGPDFTNGPNGDTESWLTRVGNALRWPVRLAVTAFFFFLLGSFVDDLRKYYSSEETTTVAVTVPDRDRVAALEAEKAALVAANDALEHMLELQRHWVPKPVPRPERTTLTSTTTEAAWDHIPRRTDCNC